jgi:hypothetical protein
MAEGGESMSGDLEDELGRLYGVDLADFVGERTRLASALKNDGRRAEAARVQELRKPSLPVWTVNQLARQRRKEVDLLLDAGHRLAAAQRALLTGGDQTAFERARSDEQAALKRLAGAARTILAERASNTTLERVTATLRAAAVSDDARPDLARGRLTEEVASTGFEAFAGSATSTATPRKQTAPSRRRSASNDRESQAAAQRAAAKRDEVARAQAELRAAEERASRLAEQLREAEHTEQEARAGYDQAKQAVKDLRAEYRAASRVVDAARQACDRRDTRSPN